MLIFYRQTLTGCVCVCVFLCVRARFCADVSLILEDFQSLTGKDKRLQGLRVILLSPKCSLSAVSNPVEIILQENRGTQSWILKKRPQSEPYL